MKKGNSFSLWHFSITIRYVYDIIIVISLPRCVILKGDLICLRKVCCFYFFLLLGLIAKNNSLIIAVAVVILLKLFHVDGKVMEIIQAKGINWGVTIITVAILIPIATGQIGFKDLIDSFKSAAGWIGLGAGIAVSILAKKV